MTIRETLEKRLIACGLDQDMAKRVMNNVVLDPYQSVMFGLWDNPCETFPQTLMNMSWLFVRGNALKLLDLESPNNPLREMFSDDKDFRDE